MKTKDKLKLARKLMTPAEIRAHTSPYLSRAWIIRKVSKQIRERFKSKVNN